MKTIFPVLKSSVGVLAVAMVLIGCATAPKKMEPTPAAGAGELLKGMDVVQQPALEPEWADFVKEHYPNWRRHYWVDRGQWGNRGYLVGKAPGSAEPAVTTQITPLPPVPPAPVEPPTIVPAEPPPAEAATKPTTYIVKKGDSLWRIAGKVYGNPLKWGRIYRANKDKIKHANRIYPGQVLTIPWD
jgi:hypothetical protein